ncbi:hypothetical protein [Acetivibrio ethanolgignens]|uniref:Competence protein CoiA n=1 Tax=Acetivibrio ethanolgignens TaxID=290052 RepID=A0A0V8QAZ8_9FIRM|nr:hypothetical protein [Acetivibrio ethanolgignens]KSV57781.1 hypothetical protein ASU35_15175 [Acetivibrio ethanolgignens]
MEIIERDLPQLIVGLDSLDESANYIHIADVKENTNYYCPCCRGLIKPRAYKKDIDYQVKPHFYHETGGCSDETYIHYICKNWLFEKGCKFIVNSVEYEVDHIEIEKTLHTSFGDYRPDIIVTTTVGKMFYFEIKVSNKKTELYAPKWDELGNDVVEVDTRYFINQKYKNGIPEFNLIYSDGVCFIKSYSRTDYEGTIAKRKLELKRQDKLNYKIQWERLDWFWIEMQKYIVGESTDENVLESFNKLDYSDKLWCYYTIKRKSCVDLKEPFKNNINQHFLNMLDSLKNDKISILLKQVSPKIYEVQCRTEFLYLDYTLFEEETTKVKVQKGDILSLDYEEDIRKGFYRLQEHIKQCENILKHVKHISNLSYVKSIAPHSHWASEQYNFHNLYFDIEFEDYIHNKSIKEKIGDTSIVSRNISESFIEEKYNKYKNDKLVDLENEIIKTALMNNQLYQNVISELIDICNQHDYLKIRVSNDYRRITLLNGCTLVFEYEYYKQDLFGEFENDIRELFVEYINKQIEQYEKIVEYVELVNACKNKMWEITHFDGNFITLYLLEPSTNKELKFKYISLCNSNDIRKDIYDNMKYLLEYAESQYGIRFVEVR